MCSLVAYESSDESEEESGDKNLDLPVSKEVKNVSRNEYEIKSSEAETYIGDSEDSIFPVSVGQLDPKDTDAVPTEMHTLLSGTPTPQKAISESPLFSSLPEPKKNNVAVDPDERFVTSSKIMQKKPTVKISIPSLSEFNDQDEEEPKKKKLKPSTKGSGLFSLLPAPKNAATKETKRPLIPHVLKKKPDDPPAPKSVHKLAKKKNDTVVAPGGGAVDLKNSALISYADSEEESDNESDFFSLNKDTSKDMDATSTVLDAHSITQDNESKSSSGLVDGNSPTIDEPLAFSAKFNPSPWSGNASGAGLENSWQKTEGGTQITGNNNISVQQDLELDEEALLRLCGRRAKRQHQEMQLVEVSGDAIMPDPKEWLTKQLTQEQDRKSHSHRKNDGPTTQQRRKHQITYLAFQAKENELELKNQWSQNRMSRKQTQSKYGF